MVEGRTTGLGQQSATEGSRVIVVTGDMTIDWNIARRPRQGSGGVAWSADDWSRACPQPGGAALLVDLLKAVAADLSNSGNVPMVVRSVPRPAEPIHPGAEPYHHSYATWGCFEDGNDARDATPHSAWRVSDFFGLDRYSPTQLSAASALRVVDDTPEASLIVLDDAEAGSPSKPS